MLDLDEVTRGQTRRQTESQKLPPCLRPLANASGLVPLDFNITLDKMFPIHICLI